jgi:hypothetical protein
MKNFSASRWMGARRTPDHWAAPQVIPDFPTGVLRSLKRHHRSAQLSVPALLVPARNSSMLSAIPKNAINASNQVTGNSRAGQDV